VAAGISLDRVTPAISIRTESRRALSFCARACKVSSSGSSPFSTASYSRPVASSSSLVRVAAA
jgi:hypothetical protein